MMKRLILSSLCAGFLFVASFARGSQEPTESAASADQDATVTVTGASQQNFPKIAVQFEVKRPDGSYVLDATKDEFRVTEEGKELKILDFQAPRTREAVPTTIVLVVDHSGSMGKAGRMTGLKAAVNSFMDRLPKGSRVSVIGFSSEVEPLCDFTDDREVVRSVVNGLEPEGATRFYDAVAGAIALLEEQSGRRAVLALTDGEDTSSAFANLDNTIALAQKVGLPVYTLGLGNDDRRASGELKQLAVSTRGQFYPAADADQLRSIYETIAERIGASFSLAYESDRRLPDGTLRTVGISYRGSKKTAETAVFIPGMVVPSAGWSPLFLTLLAALGALAVLPSRWLRNRFTSSRNETKNTDMSIP